MLAQVLAFLFLLLAACAAGPAWSCALERVTEMPVQMLGTVPLVTADINGHAASLLLDTGSNVTMLNSIAANRLGVAWEEHDPFEVAGLGGTAQAFEATVQSFALGSDVKPDVDVLVAQGGPPMIDGVLGLDVLTDYEVDLDTPHRRLVLYRARSCPEASPPWIAPFTRLPVEQREFGHLLTSVELDGRTVFGLLDTGASKTFVGMAAARDAGMVRAALLTYPTVRGYSLSGGNFVSHQRRFRTLKIGDDVLEKPALYVADLPSFTGGLIIGGDYLATRRVWFSFGTGRVFVSTTDQP